MAIFQCQHEYRSFVNCYESQRLATRYNGYRYVADNEAFAHFGWTRQDGYAFHDQTWHDLLKVWECLCLKPFACYS